MSKERNDCGLYVEELKRYHEKTAEVLKNMKTHPEWTQADWDIANAFRRVAIMEKSGKKIDLESARRVLAQLLTQVGASPEMIAAIIAMLGKSERAMAILILFIDKEPRNLDDISEWAIDLATKLPPEERNGELNPHLMEKCFFCLQSGNEGCFRIRLPIALQAVLTMGKSSADT